MKFKLKQLKPINDLELFESTFLYKGDAFKNDNIIAQISRVHGGYIYTEWLYGYPSFVPYLEFKK